MMYLSIDDFFDEFDRLEAESHIKFYEWMQKYQDISAAKRILEVETDLELFQKFEQENEKSIPIGNSETSERS